MRRGRSRRNTDTRRVLRRILGIVFISADVAGGTNGPVHDALVKKNYVQARTAQNAATTADTAIHRQAQKLGLTFCQQLLTNWPA